MTGTTPTTTLTTQSIQNRLKVIEELLSPLAKGQTVMLRVVDPRMPRKTRKYPTLLVLTPMAQFGMDANLLLAAMPPYGSEILDTRTDLKPVRLARLGLSFTMATALSTALRKILWRMP